MKEIGGYFELEIQNGGPGYHPNAIALNTGRNALEYILRARQYKKVYLPAYHCDVMLEPLVKLGISYSFYNIDYNFEFAPISLQPNEALIYINYFGLKDDYIQKLSTQYPTLIVDNAQAFFSQALPGIDTYYSARKFFGVPDGGYAYTDARLPQNLPIQTNSFEHYQHLVGRIDNSASAHYHHYSAAEKSLCNVDIMQMSLSTQSVLSQIDYNEVIRRRRENYKTLHALLKNDNRLHLPDEGVFLCYPFLNDAALKQKLIKNKVYTPTYWPNVLHLAAQGSVEYDLVTNLVCLPIDHRYSPADMHEIVARMNG